MITFQITYDESIPKCNMRINNHPLRGDSKLNDYINTPLERWIDYLLYQLPVETNDRDIHILFPHQETKGRKLLLRCPCLFPRSVFLWVCRQMPHK